MKIHTVEQRSEEWYALRLGKPTASEFKCLLTPTGKPSASARAYARSLAVEAFTGTPDEGFTSYWVERGKELEEEAVRAYRFICESDVQPVGFVTDDAETRGCSPDGLVGDDGMIEIKCLKRDNHLDAILNWQETASEPADYTYQVQGQLMIAERKWCDLVFYNPELPLLVVRCSPNDEIQAALNSQIEAVIIQRDKMLSALTAFSETIAA